LVETPFKLLPHEMVAQIGDGRGLRELLQNPWMAVHPPLTFIGYAAMCVPAAFVFASLVKNRLGEWHRVALPWMVFGWLSLRVGIVLGSYWAYDVLGWGGYWGRDPVDPPSLIPWITGAALLHGM